MGREITEETVKGRVNFRNGASALSRKFTFGVPWTHRASQQWLGEMITGISGRKAQYNVRKYVRRLWISGENRTRRHTRLH